MLAEEDLCMICQITDPDQWIPIMKEPNPLVASFIAPCLETRDPVKALEAGMPRLFRDNEEAMTNCFFCGR